MFGLDPLPAAHVKRTSQVSHWLKSDFVSWHVTTKGVTVLTIFV